MISVRNIAIAIIIFSLVTNVTLATVVINNDIQDDDGDDQDQLLDDNLSDLEEMTVPEQKIGDLAKYDYTVFAQMFYENRSSGEWSRYTFSGEGQLILNIKDISQEKDGFGQIHDTVSTSYTTRASLEVKVEGSETDTVTIPGSIEVERRDYENVFDGHNIKSTNDGRLAVEGLGKAFQDISRDMEYKADLTTFPDPSVVPQPTLEESIYGNGRILDLDSSGVYSPEPLPGEEYRFYNWSVEGAYKVHDYDSFLVNITSDLWGGFLKFNQQLYITPDHPFPIKGKMRTNNTFSDEDETFYIVFETTRDIAVDDAEPLKRGEKEIPWGDPSVNTEYLENHPTGEYESWGVVPPTGSETDKSSFAPFTLDEAYQYALDNSEGLDNYMDEFQNKGSVILTDARWNQSQEDARGRNRTTWWNLTFSYVTTQEEYYDYYRENDEPPEWKYRILMARSYKDGILEDTVSTFISRDEGDDRHGRMRGAVSKNQITSASKLLTSTHSEKILRSDQEVKSRLFENNKLGEDTVFYYIGDVGLNQQTNPGIMLIEQLTGIQQPEVNNVYLVQKETIYESGDTFSAAVDGNTGRYLYITEVEGSALASVFGV